MSHRIHSTHEAHGLSCEEFDELLKRADGRCEVCGIPQAEAARGLLYIDHDNRRGTGKDHIRGMTCPKCNGDLRFIDSGAKTPTSAQARYLEHAWFWTHHPSPQEPEVRPPLPVGEVEMSIRDIRRNLAQIVMEIEATGRWVYPTKHGRRIGAAIRPAGWERTDLAIDESWIPHEPFIDIKSRCERCKQVLVRKGDTDGLQ